jgi:hypothetical protein
VADDPSARPFALIRLEPPADLRQPAMLLVTAQVTLTPAEMRDFRRLLRDGRGAPDWLFDRIAAKDAVREVWRESTGERLFPSDIETTPGPGGLYRARKRSSGEGGQALPPAAVDRSAGVTVAVSAAGEAPVAIALAPLGQAEDTDGQLFDPEEERLLEAWGPDQDEASLRLRCARRAVARAALQQTRRQGDKETRRPEHQPRVLSVSPCLGASVSRCLLESGPGGEEHWRAYTCRDGAVIVAWTLGERGHA